MGEWDVADDECDVGRGHGHPVRQAEADVPRPGPSGARIQPPPGQDKSNVNRASWRAGGVAAGFISIEIVKDGYVRYRASAAERMNYRPRRVGSNENDPVEDRVCGALEGPSGFESARVRRWEDGTCSPGRRSSTRGVRPTWPRRRSRRPTWSTPSTGGRTSTSSSRSRRPTGRPLRAGRGGRRAGRPGSRPPAAGRGSWSSAWPRACCSAGGVRREPPAEPSARPSPARTRTSAA